MLYAGVLSRAITISAIVVTLFGTIPKETMKLVGTSKHSSDNGTNIAKVAVITVILIMPLLVLLINLSAGSNH